MKRILKFSLVIPLILSFSLDVSAQSRRRRTTTTPSDYYSSGSDSSTTTTTSSSSVYSGGGNAGRMAVSGGIGFYGAGGAIYTQGTSGSAGPALSGMFGLGGDFDYYMSDDMSVGGLFRYYNTSDTLGNTEHANTLMTIGGLVRAHVFETTNWSGNFTTGFGMISATVKQGNTTIDPGTAFGFYFGVALLYKVSSGLHVGVENLRMMGLGSSVNGWPLDDYFIKGRFFF